MASRLLCLIRSSRCGFTVSRRYTSSIKSRLEDTNTLENLKQAFAEEAMASLRYRFFAEQADREGYTEVADLFRSLAESEASHCIGTMNYLKLVADPLTHQPIGDTISNLQASIIAESHDQKELYPKLALTAKKEGVDEVAELFAEHRLAEARHEKRLREALSKIEAAARKRD
eukprot:TRINITY_DN693_c0_g1_i1.p1 TRINITY_DN693_c0_g1~~TRINITY_DN693_c0_g1_i1.p1  ORF type:complete len:173 (-),score=20.18 TRINITY_DN693_c0_g1_i1:64-582(-)